ncbi:MAG: hypothetical protein ACI9JN_001012 [Bacteroidia bacterium]|jgi:hypothetical protein
MTYKRFIFNPLLLSVLQMVWLSSCTAQTTEPDTVQPEATFIIDQVKDIPLPEGYERLEFDSSSVATYLQNLSLKEDKQVYLYNGQLKHDQTVQYAVIDMDVGTRDLQQCADATMRLRAEHLYQTKQFSQIAFHFTSGHLASWSSYAQGYRAKISGSNVQWVKTAKPDTTYSNFRKYMDLVFSYCGTRSMDKEVVKVNVRDIQPGDVFHETGNPYGHAITVMDVAQDSLGNKIFLLAQSYMPAQSIHILVNPNDLQNSPWYALENGKSLVTPEWVFPPNSLKRWKN